MAEYIFPMLSTEDIISSVECITEADFKKPEPSRWYKIYGMLFEFLTDEKAEDGEEKALVLFPKYCKAENPEFYEDACCSLWFTLVLQRILYDCGIDDFNFKDIREPKQKRCIHICSAIVNFMRFKSNHVPRIEFILEKLDRSKIQYDQILKTNRELKNHIAIEMAEHNEKESKIQQLQEELRIINENMATVQIDSQSMLTKVSEKKMRMSEARAYRDEVKCQLMKVTQDGKKLQQGIVHSPQKLKDNLSSMHEKVESFKLLKAEKVELVSTRRQRLDELKTRHAIGEQGIRFMQSMVEEVQNRKSVEEEIKGIKDYRQENAHKTKAIRIEEEVLIESSSRIRDRIQKVQLQRRTRAADLDAYISDTGVKTKKAAANVDALQAEIEKLKREKETRMQNIELNKNKIMDKTNTIMQYYKNILESLNQYHFSLNEKITESA